ncbi:MAG: hypothetical protein KJ944_15215 [Alphaproteobacteria bacterium]|nr:hypothetical protein [Alphaproteobacteria bacterium]MBU1563219.1 hypothetical protein [Alphaproteobacteria bacterium]MBU2303940.1 hypothetical protein [Alphaproteobacteria bacterium]MBU2368338.1 hypothetical protein [Alphaproteobacteria bacterium]
MTQRNAALVEETNAAIEPTESQASNSTDRWHLRARSGPTLPEHPPMAGATPTSINGLQDQVKEAAKSDISQCCYHRNRADGAIHSKTLTALARPPNKISEKPMPKWSLH